MPMFLKSILRLKMSDDMSMIRGTLPVSGNLVHWMPPMVSLEVTWTYWASGEKLEIFRDIGEILVLGGGGDVHRAEQLGFLDGFLGPFAGVDVIGFLAFEQVHGDHAELQAGAALQEHDGVVFRHAEQGADLGFGRVDHRFEILGAVADLHDRKADAVEIQQFLLGFFHDFLGQDRRSGVEIILFSHM